MVRKDPIYMRVELSIIENVLLCGVIYTTKKKKNTKNTPHFKDALAICLGSENFIPFSICIMT